MDSTFIYTNVIFEILSFSTLKEITCVSAACSRLHSACKDEKKLWRQLVLERIAPIQANSIDPVRWTDSVLDRLIDVNTYFDLFCIFYRATTNPLVTVWTEIPKPGNSYLNPSRIFRGNRVFVTGTAYGIQIRDGRFVMGQVAPDGQLQYQVIFVFQQGCYLEYNPHKKKLQRMKIVDGPLAGKGPSQSSDVDPNIIEFEGNRMIETFHEYGNARLPHVRTYDRVPENISVPFSSFPPDLPSACYSKLHEIQGMFTGCYASHGLEILHCGLCRNDSTISNHQIDVLAADEMYFRGLKIAGDPNVPGWAISFAIQLHRAYDTRELELEERPIVMFSPDHMQRIMTRGERSSYIAHCFRGYGQINRIPGQWSPEWENVIFLIYHKPLTLAESGGSCDDLVFSVIFESSLADFRHIIDFKRLPYEGINGWGIK